MITSPQQAGMAVDLACRSALSQRGVSHITIPIDVQEMKLKARKYSTQKYVGIQASLPDSKLIEKAANILNSEPGGIHHHEVQESEPLQV